MGDICPLRAILNRRHTFNLWVANSASALNYWASSVWYHPEHARHFHSCSAYNRHHNAAGSTRRTSFRRCRIRFDETSSRDSESCSEACPQPSGLRSHRGRFVHFADASGTDPAIRHRAEAINSAAFSQDLTKQKYRLLFSPTRVRPPGPKGPAKELIDAVVEMKRRNRTGGCKRIAQQITLAFGVEIDKDVVRRILSTHFRPETGSGGPSWLSFLGHAKDSLWSVDLFRCESAILRTHWVLVVMDQFYATDRRLCRSQRRRGWSRLVPDVQSRDSCAYATEISHFGS
jgi:hypothetical protein